EELADLPGNDFGLVKRGLLMLCKTAQTLDEEAALAERARELGLPADVLDAKQTAALDPGVRMDIAGAVYFPKDCHLSPHLFMAGLKKQLDSLGAKFSWETEVIGFTHHTSRISSVQTSRGDFSADEFVLCGGAWSSALARQLRLNLPMQAGKG